MKALTLIPKKVRDTYQITRQDDCLSINDPCFVHIDFDKEFKIINTISTISIKNDKCIVFLNLHYKYVHITIF